MPRKKQWPVWLPQGHIESVMSRVHVGTPDAEVEADWRRRCTGATLAGTPATEEQIKLVIKFALHTHHQNCKLYSDVMSGRIGRSR
jgi:hypothetical protein